MPGETETTMNKIMKKSMRMGMRTITSMAVSAAMPARRVLVWLFFVLCLIGPAAAQEATPPALSELQQAQMDAAIRDYLLRHPEVVVEALQRYEVRMREAAAAEQQRNFARYIPEILADGSAPRIGAEHAAVEIVEFFDYRCGYCKRMFPDLVRSLDENSDLAIQLRELPILGPASVLGARAALAAKKQGHYWDFHVALMRLRGELTESGIMQISDNLGLDRAQLRRDMDDPAITAHIEANLQLARELGIDGTPAMIIGARIVPGAVGYDRLHGLIADARAAGG